MRSRPTGRRRRYNGPLHNKIDQPNRAIDNSTLWQSDYNVAHYKNMYFNRMAEYFERQSSNRYSVMGRRRQRLGQGAVQRGALRP